MMGNGNDSMDQASSGAESRGEILTFAVLAVLIWPILAVAFVGGYGFLVWMSQLVLGPPGPPG
jgi:nitrate reductase NapE